MMKICIFQGDSRTGDVIGLLGAARLICGGENFTSFAVTMNRSCRDLSGFFHHVIPVKEGLVEGYDQRGICEIVEALHGEHRFDVLLIPATPLGRMLAPRLAKRLKTGLVADVTDIRRHGEDIEMIRPAYSGRILAGIVNKGAGPVMMSVRPGVFTREGKGTLETEFHEYARPLSRRTGLKKLEEKVKARTYDIRDCDVLVSGGGGVRRSFAELRRLADALSGQVSASRKIVDSGIAPRSIQVGQSGKTVNPRLYIALGIDGAIQHVEGLKNIETIISVNTSRMAPLCSLSDIVVEGDALEFIDGLTERIERDRNERKGELA